MALRKRLKKRGYSHVGNLKGWIRLFIARLLGDGVLLWRNESLASCSTSPRTTLAYTYGANYLCENNKRVIISEYDGVYDSVRYFYRWEILPSVWDCGVVSIVHSFGRCWELGKFSVIWWKSSEIWLDAINLEKILENIEIKKFRFPTPCSSLQRKIGFVCSLLPHYEYVSRLVTPKIFP